MKNLLQGKSYLVSGQKIIMAQALVTYQNIIEQSYQNLLSLIDNKNNIPDPLSSISKRKMVYTREPDIKGHNNFEGYPFIILPIPSVTFGKSNLGTTKRRVEWEFRIEIYVSDRIPNKKHSGKGAQYLRQMADDIIQNLNNRINRTTLRNYGMSNVFPDFEVLEPAQIHNELVYIGKIKISFSKYLTVSS